MDTLYKSVRSRKRLSQAWRKVNENGRISKSPQTRKEVAVFSNDADSNIERIYRSLLTHRFAFAPARGVLIDRPGKKPRPLVVSPIPSRIVQRSILDVLQSLPEIQNYVKTPTSFGGIEHRGVRHAIESAYRAMNGGTTYFIRTDIKSFFTGVPRDEVLKRIAETIEDNSFNKLLKDAVTTELSNMEELKKAADLFPIYEIGVAQGCCLSPLFANVLLYDFDKQMNQGHITCLRYIDDFVLLGPDQKTVRAAFKEAMKMLAQYSLEVYDPAKEKDKSEEGYAKNGFKFLGCKILPGLISPNKKSRERLLNSIRDLLDKSIRSMSNPLRASQDRTSFADTLVTVSRILKGWGDQYSYCNNKDMMAVLDGRINEQLSSYCGRYEQMKKLRSRKDALTERRLMGVHLLTDSKQDPILVS
jgi:retron-type reverse transcriptase